MAVSITSDGHAIEADEEAPPHAMPGPPAGYNPELERIEIELLLEGVFRHYGFDFRSYAYASIRRRLWKRAEAEGLQNLSELQGRVLHDVDAMERMLLDLSVNVTAMFRDPGFYVTKHRGDVHRQIEEHALHRVDVVQY